MEAWRIAIPIIVLIVACMGAYYTIRIMAKERNERTYVYPKTGHKYMPLYRCKLKCPVNGEWFDALIYQGLDDGGKLYVRERKDFLDKFVKLQIGKMEQKIDNVNHPPHYTWLKDKCGIEVIDITRHMDFCLGNAIKYVLRAGHKQDASLSDNQKEIEDLKKAIWYINDRIKQLGGEV